jgi:salicylate hydroxylase
VGEKQTNVQGFSKFHPGVQKMVGHAGSNLKVWKLFDMECLPSWTSGHAALLGDAAHPFQPCKTSIIPVHCETLADVSVKDMGQGGAMAIEDAVGIATLLPLGTRPEDIPTRLQLYQSSRQPRVEMVLNFTRLNGRDENDTAGRRITRKSPSLPVSKITKMVGS